MSRKIPLKLKTEPIIDAVIEVRLKASKSLSDILPGVLMQQLGKEVGDIERLPASSLPKQLRDNDPNLTYQHLVRIDLAGYSLFVGDRSITLACVMPYPGGSVFKGKAVEVFKQALELPIVDEITRISVKYTDLIEGDQLSELLKYLELDISAGQKKAHEFKGFNLQLSLPEDDVINLIKVIGLADIKFGQELQKQGLILEVDSIKALNETDTSKFSREFSDLLDVLHLTNKKNFFSLLTPHALKKLGAVYENH